MKKKRMVISACAIGMAGIVIGASAATVVKDIRAELRTDFEVVVDGKKQNFKNVNGDRVYPILYDGTTYLPVRAIGELMGKTVYWYQDEKRIELKDKEAPLVTDADVIIDGKGKDKKDKSGKVRITEEEAKAIALKELGIKAEDATVLIKLEFDDGVYEYDCTISTSDMVYSLDVNADTGAVRDIEKRIYADNGDVGAEAAKKAALNRAGFTENQVTRLRVDIDVKRGVKYYEIEFVKDGIEYSADVKAEDASIVKWETERDD